MLPAERPRIRKMCIPGWLFKGRRFFWMCYSTHAAGYSLHPVSAYSQWSYANKLREKSGSVFEAWPIGHWSMSREVVAHSPRRSD